MFVFFPRCNMDLGVLCCFWEIFAQLFGTAVECNIFLVGSDPWANNKDIIDIDWLRVGCSS